MFWNNQAEETREGERERKENMCSLSGEKERTPIVHLTWHLVLDATRRKSDKPQRFIPMFPLCILISLAGSLVAFDTAAENYTVPISGKCVLSCYVAEVRSFKVSSLLLEHREKERGSIDFSFKWWLLLFDSLLWDD